MQTERQTNKASTVTLAAHARRGLTSGMHHSPEKAWLREAILVVSRAIRILRAPIGGARKGKRRGKNTYGIKGHVFVRRRNVITLIRCIIPRECHMKLQNRVMDGRQELTHLAHAER